MSRSVAVKRQSSRITVTAHTGRRHAARTGRYLKAACGLVPHPPAEVSLAFVGNKRMADLHEQFLGIAGPTDVLTFELDHDTRGRCTAGEIIVCVPHATRIAKVMGVPLRDELLLYALHGLLHLCGYDDRTDADFRRMHRLEDRILTKLGIGAVFQRVPFIPARPTKSQ